MDVDVREQVLGDPEVDLGEYATLAIWTKRGVECARRLATREAMKRAKIGLGICCFLQSRAISIRGGLILVGVGTRDPQGVFPEGKP